MANQEYGAKLTADPSGFVGGVGAAQKAAGGLNQELDKSSGVMKSAAEQSRAFVDNLKQQADTLGKTRAQVDQYRASQLTLTDAQKASVDQSIKSIAAYDQQQRALATLRTVALAAGLSLTVLATSAVASIKGTIDTAAALNNLSQSLGMSVESLSVYRYEADLAGVASEDFATGMKLLARNVSEAQGGFGTGAQIFHSLGGAVEQAAKQGASLEKLLPLLADRFSQFADGPNKTALALALFGRAGEQLIPFLNKGADGISQLRAEAERLGIVMGGDLAQRADEFNNNLRRLEANSEALKIQLTEGLIPALNGVLEAYLKGSQQGGHPAGMWAAIKEMVTKAPVGAFGAIPGIGPLLTGAQMGAQAFGGTQAQQQGESELDALRSAMGGFATYKGGPQAPALNSGEYQRLAAQVNVLNTALAQQLNTSDKLTQADQIRAQINEAVTTGNLKLTDSERAVLNAKLDQAKAAEQQLRDREREVQLVQQASAAYDQLTQAQEAAAQVVFNYGVATQRSVEQLQLETTLIEHDTERRREAMSFTTDRLQQIQNETQLQAAANAERDKAIAFKQVDLDLEQQMLALGPEATPEDIASLYKLADARKAALGAAIDEKAAAQQAHDAAQRSAQEWQNQFERMSNNIEQAITNAIVNGGQNGWQTFANAIKAAILTPIIQPIVRPIASASAGMMQGMMGSLFGSSGPGGGMASIYGGGLTGAASALVAGGNSVFQNLGAMTGSQGIADIGNFGYGAPILGGLLTYAATGNAGAGIGSTLGGIAGSMIMPGIGTIVGSALGGALGGSLFGDSGPAQRSGNFAAGFGQVGASTRNQWFSGAEMGGAMGAFAQQMATQEQNIIHNLALSSAQVAQVNAALSAANDRTYGFGQEHTDVAQSGAFQQIQADRLQAISQVLGRSISDLTSVMSMSAQQWQAAIDQLTQSQQQAQTQLDSMVKGLPGQLGITTLENYQTSLATSAYVGPMDRLTAARSAFNDTLAKARSGDLDAINAFPGAAQSLLGIGRDVYASGSGFQDLFVSVNQALNQVLDQQRSTQADILKDVPVTIAQASADQVTALKQGFKDVVTQLQNVQQQLKLMRAGA